MKLSVVLLVASIGWILPVLDHTGHGGDGTQAIVLSEKDDGKSVTVAEDACVVIELEGESGSTGASFAPPSYDATVLEFQGKFNKTPPGVQGRVGWSYKTSFIFRVNRSADTVIKIDLLYPAGPQPFDRHYTFHLKSK